MQGFLSWTERLATDYDLIFIPKDFETTVQKKEKKEMIYRRECPAF